MNKPAFVHDNRMYHTDDILAALRAAGIESGDTIYVHSALMSFGKLAPGIKRSDFTGAFIDALRESVGSDGHLMMPTFSYSFCKNEPFDVQNSPSDVGLLTEAYRSQSSVRRTADGIFSTAVEGPDTEYFLDIGMSCFGTQSIFEKLYDRNAKFVFLGDTFDLTFIHFVEQRLGIPYRHIKMFPGVVINGADRRESVCFYNVRYLDYSLRYDMEKLARSMEDASLLTSTILGASTIRSIVATDTFKHITEGICGDLGFLLAEPPTLPQHTVSAPT